MCFVGTDSLFFKGRDLYRKLTIETDNLDSDVIDVSMAYTRKHYEEFRALQSPSLEEEYLRSLIHIFERDTTPNGDIIISYNHKNSVFNIWSDNKNIPYFILDSLAQLYSIKHNCKSICIDYDNEYDKALLLSKEDEHIKPIEPVVIKPINSVFATYKSYNMNTKDANRNTSTIKKIYIIPECSNKFRHCGKLYEWEQTIDETRPKEEAPLLAVPGSRNTLSWKEFQSMQLQKTKHLKIEY